MRRVRLFAVISSAEFGGAERNFVTLLKGLAGSDIEATVACPARGPMLNEYRAHAPRLRTVDFSSVFSPAVVARLSSLMREDHAHIVHTHLWNADVLGGLAALYAGVPASVSTVHGPYHLPIGVSGPRDLRRRALSRSYRAIYRCFDRVIAVSQFVREDLAGRAGIRVDRRVIDVIPPGLDLSRIPEQAAPVAGSGDPPRIIHIGSFFPIKGQELLLRAMPSVLSRFPKAQCLFVGDGPNRSTIEALAGSLRLEGSVRFTGAISNPLDLLAQSHVLVLPSITEGLGITLLEAWALSLPVVASRVGGIPEAVEDGRTGLLIPAGDPEALADSITAVLSDRALARRLGEAGREAVRSRYSSRLMVDRLGALYRRLAVERR